MAKIYETQEDLTRDTLKDQAARLRSSANAQSAAGATFLGGSFLADLYYERKPHTRGWLRAVSGVSGLMGIVEVVRSWFTKGKAHDAELQLERMGPQPVILPAEVASALPTPEKEEDCVPCRIKKGKLGRKTLIEYAMRSDERSAGKF